MPWWAWSIVANIAIQINEYIARRAGVHGFIETLPYTAVPIVVLQVAIFYMYRDAKSFMLAWAVYFVGSVSCRFVTASLVGEPPSLLQALGVAVIVGGAVLVKLGS